MVVRVLSKEDLKDLVIGAKILGTGGGGSEKEAKRLIEEIFQRDKKVKLVSVDEAPDDRYFAIIGMVGGGITEEERKESAKLEITINSPMLKAVEKLEEYLKKEKTMADDFYGFFATEIGPENIMIPIYCSAILGKVVIDGDACGRSKPEISISTTHVAGIPITPISVVSKFGDILILEKTADDYRAEKIVRKLAVIAGGEVACCRCPITGYELKKGAIVKGTISKAIELGRFVRENKNKNREAGAEIASILNGKVVFEGTVAEFKKFDKSGFVWGHITLDGRKGTTFENRKIVIDFKNEYLSVTENSVTVAKVPDSIIVVDSCTGEGLTPWENDFKDKNRIITVIHMKADPIWLGEKGKRIFDYERLKKDFPT